MEKPGPVELRAYADLLENPQRMGNVETCKRYPSLDQHLLLALNGATGDKSPYKDGFPDAITVMNMLKDRLIEVETSDDQSAVLGLFYTNYQPITQGWAKVAVGIFPYYAKVEKYVIRPTAQWWLRERGEIQIVDESLTGDPFLVLNPNGPDFLFFKKSPFSEEQPYRSALPELEHSYLPEPELYEDALEENVINRTLWYVDQNIKPRLFYQKGFKKFINSHCSEPVYIELHAAFTQKKRYTNTKSPYAY